MKTTTEADDSQLTGCRVQGVKMPLLENYDPAGGKVPFYNEPDTDWKRLPIEDFELDGVAVRIISPERPLPGKLWLLERAFGDPMQVARALLEKGIYFVSMLTDDFGSSQSVSRWNALYTEMTERRGFSSRVALQGYSRSGLGVYNWAAANPEKVACVYVDAPVLDIKSWPGGKGKGPGWPDGWRELQKLYGFTTETEAVAYNRNPVDNTHVFAQSRIALMHVCGDKDEIVPYEENTGLFRQRYEKAGGHNMTVITKGGTGHWTHGLKDATPVVEFILGAIQEPVAATSRTNHGGEKI